MPEIAREGQALPHNKKKLLHRILCNWELYIFVLPLVVYFVLFRYMPMYGVQIAFKNFKVSKGIMGSEWVGFRYFMQFFRSFYFETVIRNTLTITLLSLVLGFPLPILLALALNETTAGLKRPCRPRRLRRILSPPWLCAALFWRLQARPAA